MRQPHEYGEDIVNRLTVQKLLADLSDEEREILKLICWDDETYATIGKVVGQKYRERDLSGSGIRWLRDEIFDALRGRLQRDGIKSSKG